MAATTIVLSTSCDVAPGTAQAQPHEVLAAHLPGKPAAAKADTPRAEACPSGMVLAGSFCIDRYEAHLVEADGQSVHSPYVAPKAGTKYLAVSSPGVVPQGYINRIEAGAACAASGKRLCQATEWQAACKGKAGFKYPYGRDEVVGRCNTQKPHLPTKLFGSSVMRYTEQHLRDPRLNREPGFLSKTGEHPACVSDYGAFDMMGNLHEWVADDVNGALPKKVPIPYGIEEMGRRGNGVFMGGYFSSKREHGRGCEYVTTHHAPGYQDYSIGFRCCKDPAAAPR